MLSEHRSLIVPALLVAVGIALAGLLVGQGFKASRSGDRFVTVKGLAEREVQADLAIWPISFVVTDNDLQSLQREIDHQRELIVGFLTKMGFERADISMPSPQIQDTRAEFYGSRDNAPQFRYRAQGVVTTRTQKVDLVRQAMEQTPSLVGQGIALTNQSWENPTEFLFTGLNAIKPEMIAQATLNARDAAEQFAHDSGSEVGRIRRASQGLFSIDERDRNSPELKVVRVVNTVEYFLED